MDIGTNTGLDGSGDPSADRVRGELRRLADDLRADDATAPEVPPEVTARIGAALRHAPAHASRPPLGALRLAALILGVLAVVAAVVLGVARLTHKPPSPFSDPGPTAERITVTPTTPAAGSVASSPAR